MTGISTLKNHPGPWPVLDCCFPSSPLLIDYVDDQYLCVAAPNDREMEGKSLAILNLYYAHDWFEPEVGKIITYRSSMGGSPAAVAEAAAGEAVQKLIDMIKKISEQKFFPMTVNYQECCKEGNVCDECAPDDDLDAKIDDMNDALKYTAHGYGEELAAVTKAVHESVGIPWNATLGGRNPVCMIADEEIEMGDIVKIKLTFEEQNGDCAGDSPIARTTCSCETLLNGHWNSCPMKKE